MGSINEFVKAMGELRKLKTKVEEYCKQDHGTDALDHWFGKTYPVGTGKVHISVRFEDVPPQELETALDVIADGQIELLEYIPNKIIG